MAFACRVEADSISPDGARITTFVVTFPRFILAEWNTHRMLSRNAASSRAIPTAKRIEAVIEDPFIPQPAYNKKGMQAGDPLHEVDQASFRKWWLWARDQAVHAAEQMPNVHKQWVNRLLEPFAWVTVVATATEWNNFFALRCHPDAQPEFRHIAELMKADREASTPVPLEYGQWHLPFVTQEELAEICAEGPAVREKYKWVSAGRCARVSYLTHEGIRDPAADVTLAQKLSAHEPRHSSPFEHMATPIGGEEWCANFRGWKQLRKTLTRDYVPG